MDTKTLGQNVRKYRLEAGLTQETASELAGLSSNYLRQIEMGNKTPRLETFIKIAEVLHVSADKLLFGNLSCSTDSKSCELQERLDSLPSEKKQYILTVLDSMIQNI